MVTVVGIGDFGVVVKKELRDLNLMSDKPQIVNERSSYPFIYRGKGLVCRIA
ncbi:MAG: hypothetical protein AAF497_06095 [Planctomycetota bacterium]